MTVSPFTMWSQGLYSELGAGLAASIFTCSAIPATHNPSISTELTQGTLTIKTAPDCVLAVLLPGVHQNQCQHLNCHHNKASQGKQGAQSYIVRKLPPQAPALLHVTTVKPKFFCPTVGTHKARLPCSVSCNPLIKGITSPSQISIPMKYQAGPLEERRRGGGQWWGTLGHSAFRMIQLLCSPQNAPGCSPFPLSREQTGPHTNHLGSPKPDSKHKAPSPLWPDRQQTATQQNTYYLEGQQSQTEHLSSKCTNFLQSVRTLHACSCLGHPRPHL